MSEPETEEERAERLRTFVIDFCDGKIWTDLDCQDAEGVRMCFLVLNFMEEPIPDDTGRIWEHISRAGPTGVNGMPSFFSCHLMKKDDWERVQPAIAAEMARRKAVKV